MENLKGGTRTVVEHPVFFKMPRLAGNKEQEMLILERLDALKSAFPGLLSLTTGKLLKEQAGCTHAIFVRFEHQEQLVDYYNSEQLMDVIRIMLPELTGEYTVDYEASIKDEFEEKHIEASMIHITFFRVKDDSSQEMVDELLQALHGLKDNSATVMQVTAGANNYIRSKAFSHAFVAHLSSVEDFYTENSVTEVFKQLESICSRIISVDLHPFRKDGEGSKL